MAEPNQDVVDEVIHEGETIGERGIVGRIERHHGPGVRRETLEAYAREFETREDYAFDADGFLADVWDNVTDAEWWEGGVYYDVGDGRLSLFPKAWHERLGGSTDAVEYVEFMLDEDPTYVDGLDANAAGDGVPEEAVVQALVHVGGLDRPDATTALHEARDRGDVAEDADQHPEASVYPADRAPDEF